MSRTSNDTNEHDLLRWADKGLCVGSDPDLFFPQRGEDMSCACEMCRSCPVRQACLDYAIESNQRFGIWGGKSPSQRRRMQRLVKPEVRTVRHLRLLASTSAE